MSVRPGGHCDVSDRSTLVRPSRLCQSLRGKRETQMPPLTEGRQTRLRVARPRARAPTDRLVRPSHEATRSRAIRIQLAQSLSYRRARTFAGPDAIGRVWRSFLSLRDPAALTGRPPVVARRAARSSSTAGLVGATQLDTGSKQQEPANLAAAATMLYGNPYIGATRDRGKHVPRPQRHHVTSNRKAAPVGRYGWFGICTRPRSRIYDDFTDRTAEQNLQTVKNVPAQDAFVADKVRLQSARIFLPVKQCPDLKC